MKPAVIPIHTKVPGRARLKIRPRPHTPLAWSWVHTELQRLLGIDRVKINAVTGSLLVFFDKAEDWQTINERINKLIQRLARNGFRPPLRATSAGRPRGQADKWHQLEAGR
ncbi:MAG: hypothetical protein PVF59_03380, partial [Desulfobacterales bacterium]